jgi:hypothetical protein
MLAAMRPRSPLAFIAVGAIVLGTLGALEGCGGGGSSNGGTVSASSYAGQVCTSLAGWLRDIQRRANKLEGEVGTHASPAQGKAVLERFMSVAVADTENATNALRGAGVPDVKNGRKISTALVEAFERAEHTLKGMQASVASLPSNSASALQAEAKHITNGVQTLPVELTSGLSGLSSKELDKAAAESPACRSVNAKPKS